MQTTFLKTSHNYTKQEKSSKALAYYVAEIENKEELLKVFAQSKSSEAVTQWFLSSELSMTDKDGIVTRVRVGN